MTIKEDNGMTTSTCRRAFLKSSLFFAATILSSKSALAKLWVEHGRMPEGRLSLHNINNNERLTVTYRNELGVYDSEALQALNWALRCHTTNETTSMDLRVIEHLHRLLYRPVLNHQKAPFLKIAAIGRA